MFFFSFSYAMLAARDPGRGREMVRVVAAVAEELGDIDGVALGVGPLRAAAAAARLLALERPDGVLLVGTAGAYRGGPAIGSVVAAGTCGWRSGAATYGLGYVPLAPPTIAADVGIGVQLGLPQVPVLTVAAITTSEALAMAFAAEGWAVEHLEAYAVALACADAGVPFGAILGITNEVGPSAHAQWIANRSRVERAVQDALRSAGQILSASPATAAIRGEP
jgi:purine-nucleoside phosphorylase